MFRSTDFQKQGFKTVKSVLYHLKQKILMEVYAMPRFLKRKMRNMAVKYHNGTYNLSCDYEGSRYTAWVDENLNNENYFIYKNTIADGRSNPKTRKIDTSCVFGGSLFEAMKSEASKNLMMFKARRANAELLDERRIKIAKLSMACDLYDALAWTLHRLRNGVEFSADDLEAIDTILNIANGSQKMPFAKSENSDSVVTEQ